MRVRRKSSVKGRGSGIALLGWALFEEYLNCPLPTEQRASQPASVTSSRHVERDVAMVVGARRFSHVDHIPRAGAVPFQRRRG